MFFFKLIDESFKYHFNMTCLGKIYWLILCYKLYTTTYGIFFFCMWSLNSWFFYIAGRRHDLCDWYASPWRVHLVAWQTRFRGRVLPVRVRWGHRRQGSTRIELAHGGQHPPLDEQRAGPAATDIVTAQRLRVLGGWRRRSRLPNLWEPTDQTCVTQAWQINQFFPKLHFVQACSWKVEKIWNPQGTCFWMWFVWTFVESRTRCTKSFNPLRWIHWSKRHHWWHLSLIWNCIQHSKA